ncbi:MAG: hypothetical protein Kow001_04870 [Acidobacteriota bacterium]
MVQCCEALTLRTYPFAEGHKVAVFLTREHGLVRAAAYGAQGVRSRFGSALEPLTHSRITFRRREHQELAALENCEIIRPSPAYRLGWEQQLHLGYFAELLLEFTREQIAGDRLFRLALAVMDAAERVPPRVLARYFEFWLLQLEGVLPPLGEILPEPLAARTLTMLKTPPAALEGVGWRDEDLDLLENAAGRLIENHLEKPLKAKRLLKELL